MRYALLFFTCLSLHSSFAQTPTPSPTPEDPNVLVANEGGISLAQMMLENTAGLDLLKKAHHTGPLIQSSKTELISQTQTTTPYPLWTTVLKFTIRTLDCLGTDACEGNYDWVVMATTVSTGFGYTTTYTNTVSRVVYP